MGRMSFTWVMPDPKGLEGVRLVFSKVKKSPLPSVAGYAKSAVVVLVLGL
jgi:hypothetical protein